MKGLWSFFQILTPQWPQFAKCTLCGLELARGTSNVIPFFGNLENNHKEEWSKTLFGKHSEMAGGKNEEVEPEKTEKNIKEATHEWTTVVGSNKKKLK